MACLLIYDPFALNVTGCSHVSGDACTASTSLRFNTALGTGGRSGHSPCAKAMTRCRDMLGLRQTACTLSRLNTALGTGRRSGGLPVAEIVTRCVKNSDVERRAAGRTLGVLRA